MRCGGRSWPEHGGCGDGIGRGDHRAERNRRRPRHRRDDRASDDGDGDGRESDREDHQARDRRPVVLEIPERRVVRRVEQYGCDEQRQRQFGRQREGRRGWNKGEQRTAERQEHRIRCADAACSCRQNHGGDEETEELFELSHVLIRSWFTFRFCSVMPETGSLGEIDIGDEQVAQLYG